MSILVKITLTAALLISIVIPFGALPLERKPEDATKRPWEQTCLCSLER